VENLRASGPSSFTMLQTRPHPGIFRRILSGSRVPLLIRFVKVYFSTIRVRFPIQICQAMRVMAGAGVLL